MPPPPLRFQLDHKDLSTIRPEEPTSTKSTPKKGIEVLGNGVCRGMGWQKAWGDQAAWG
ncbi:hypothetical protein CXB51_036057 [Gossypium anomalum]|uniref:Uncharacterized protein n=1 Tax=Gossypium anomalum TaxID=47600 RepID=A0A8J5XRN0_9ROSI|nr:hypothetical protein CXB51_036057 [Gossypium anomalum]